MWKRWWRRPTGPSYTISSPNSIWMHQLGHCLLNIVPVLCINMYFFVYALFWLLLPLTVYNKLGGPPHFFMYLMMTPSSWRPLHSCQLTSSRNNEWSLISLCITPKVIQGAIANQHCFDFNLSKFSFGDIKLGCYQTIWATVAHVQLYIASRYTGQ